MQAQSLVRRMIGLIDDKDFSALDEVLSPSCEFAHPAATVRGRDAVAEFLRVMGTPFPASRHSLARVVSAGDTVILEGTWTGRHERPMPTPQGEVPASGRTVSLPFAAVARIGPDGIDSVHVYCDQLAFMDGLGLLPVAA